MDNLLKFFNKVDWLLAIACFIFGIYTQNPWFLLAGSVSVVTAWYKPAERIKAALEKKLLRKKKPGSDNHVIEAEDEFYARHEPATSADSLKSNASTLNYSNTAIRPGPVFLHSSKHNMLKRSGVGVNRRNSPDDSWV